MQFRAEGVAGQEVLELEIRKNKYATEFIYEKEVGTGSFGRVMKCAKQVDRNKRCAIKVIPMTDERRLEVCKIEVAMLESLRQQMTENPNSQLARFVLNFEEAWLEKFERDQPIPFIVRKENSNVKEFVLIHTEYLQGVTLNSYLKKKTVDNHTRTVNMAKKYFSQLTLGLLHLHKLGCIHRDLNPCNIILSELNTGETITKIIDFGTSRFVEDATCYFKGNISFRSPEMSDESKTYDTKTDIWSLGLIFYCIIIPKTRNITSWNYNEIVKNFSIRLQDNNYDVESSLDFRASETDLALLKEMLQHDPTERISAQSLYETVDTWQGNTSEVEIDINISRLQ